MLFLTIFCSFYLFSANPCEVERNNPEVKQIISELKSQLNIYSISCSFTSIRESLTTDYLNIIRNFDFAYEKGNLFLGVYRDDTKEKKESIHISSPNNLFNLIMKKVSKSKEDYEKTGPQRFMEGYYIYQGHPYARIFYKEGENTLIEKLESPPSPNKDNPENFNPHSTLGNPLWLIGYIGINMGSNTLTDPLRYIPEFLEKEGKYYLSKRDDFTVLWHEAKYEDGEVLSAEFWINKQGRLQKILLGDFPARSYDWDRIKTIVGPNREFNCDSFSSVYMKIEFQEYKIFNNNVCIPMTGVFSLYKPDDEDVKNHEYITEQFLKKEINYLEYLIKTEKIKMNYVGSITLKIHPDTVIVNQEIDRNNFIPPPPNFTWKTYYQNKKVEKTEKLHKGNLLFILLCVAFCTVCIVITRRYLRWSI